MIYIQHLAVGSAFHLLKRQLKLKDGFGVFRWSTIASLFGTVLPGIGRDVALIVYITINPFLSLAVLVTV